MCEECRGLQGDTELTPRALLLVLATGQRREALDGRNNPRVQKTTKKGSHNNQQVE